MLRLTKLMNGPLSREANTYETVRWNQQSNASRSNELATNTEFFDRSVIQHAISVESCGLRKAQTTKPSPCPASMGPFSHFEDHVVCLPMQDLLTRVFARDIALTADSPLAVQVC